MAKKTTTQAAVVAAGHKIEEFAEDLGRIFGHAESKAAAWMNQRTTILEQLTAVRDKASGLIASLSGNTVTRGPDGRLGERRRKASAREVVGRRTRRHLGRAETTLGEIQRREEARSSPPVRLVVRADAQLAPSTSQLSLHPSVASSTRAWLSAIDRRDNGASRCDTADTTEGAMAESARHYALPVRVSLALALAIGARERRRIRRAVARELPAPPTIDALVTLLGCVTAPIGKEKAFRSPEIDGGDRYLLQGVDVRDFVGKRVEVSGSRTRRRLVIRGGLYPNANMAGQAGDIDPTKAAMAAQAGP